MNILYKHPRYLIVGTVAALLAGALLTPRIHAYPPAPHHLIYGMVRDELGNPVAVEAAEVLFEATSGVRVKGVIRPGRIPGTNYKLEVPLDAGISDDLYRPTALRPTVPFKIRVRVRSNIYLPIEMRGDFSQLGQPAQSTRLDLTLGEDTDGDGLPDAWERALLKQGQTLEDIRAGDDTDGDGLTNLQEYISGNYAFDDKDGFELKLLQIDGDTPLMEFQAIRGRTYTVYGSANLGDWDPVAFRIPAEGDDAPVRGHYQANDVRNIRITVPPATEGPAMRFFKLMVE